MMIAWSWKTKHQISNKTLTLSVLDNPPAFTFLEAYVKIREGKIHLTHYNKNAESITIHNKQKHLRYHHAESYTSRNQKIGVMIETLIRTSRYCTSTEDFKSALKIIITEFKLLHYPSNLILDAFKKASANTNIDPTIFQKTNISYR